MSPDRSGVFGSVSPFAALARLCPNRPESGGGISFVSRVGSISCCVTRRAAMCRGETEIRIPEPRPWGQGGFPPHCPAACCLCPFAMDTFLPWQYGTMASCPSPLLQKIEAPLSCNRKASCMLVGASVAKRFSLVLARARSQTQGKPCPLCMAPTWLLPKQALVHFPVGFWLTTGILLLSNPGTKILLPDNLLTTITGWPCQDTICLPVQ